MKKIISLLVVVSFIAVVASPAFAGEKQRHRWQGVAIGLGAAILGNAIFNADDGRDYRRPPRQYHPPVVYGGCGGESPVYKAEYEREQARLAEERRQLWEQAERERARRDAQRASGYGGYYGRNY